MLFSVLAVIILSGVSKVAGVTASDLPDCAIECYLDSNQKVGLQLEDYEGRCRAAPFQLAMRSCAAKACNYEEYTFVSHALKGVIKCRWRSRHRNTVKRISVWISETS